MAYAQTSDVEARLGRPLTADETTFAATLLDDAELSIKSRISDFDAQVAADIDYKNTVIKIEAWSAVRVLRNPDGYMQELDGSYSYMRSQATATGQLAISDSEWAELGISSDGAFTITLVSNDPGYTPYDPSTGS